MVLSINSCEDYVENHITDATTLQIGQVLKLPSDTGSANDDAAAPAEQTAAELAPVRSWSLPFSTTAPSTDEVARYMKALQNEEHGFYGLGKNGCWHGGVYFSRALNAENSVHCIADGEIIAWRFNQDNEKITSGKDTAHYSTNFVLVRHRLELPNEKKETQDFYSLYMHLASLSESRDNAQPTAFDPNANKGEINVPYPPIAVTAGELLGYIGQFATGENPTANNADTLHLEVFADTSLEQFISAGRQYDTTLPANQKPWLIVAPGAQTAKARPSDTTLKHALHTGKGAAGWALVQPCAKGIVLHKDVLTGFNNNSYPNNNRVREAVSRQSGVDESLLTSDRAYWDGYYYDSNWARNTEATHFDADFDARNNASATHRGILLPHGDPVWINAPIQEEGTLHDAENIEAWHFPFSTDALEGPEAKGTTTLFVNDIEASLEEQRDGETIHWYQVTYTTEDGEHTGWVCSQGQQHVSLHSQWGWPGFEVVDNTQLTLDQYFARQMLAGNNVTEEEKSTFQAPAQAVETGPIFERIYQIISKQMEPLLPPKDIPKTMCQPKVQQDLSRLIIEQPTEWQSSKPWSCLDEYMHDEAKPGWDATKEQIDKLAWWDEVNTKAKLNLGCTVMNVHPVALVSNMQANKPWFNIDRFVEIYKQRHAEAFGFYEKDKKIKISALNTASEEALVQLLEEMKKQYYTFFKNFNEKYIAYMLSTIRIESYQYKKRIFFAPVSEEISYEEAEKSYGSGPTAVNSERAKLNHNTELGDGYKFRGRGLVQLTWKINYKKFANLLKVDLLSNPDLASNLDVSVQIMMLGMKDGLFRPGHTLSKYLDDEDDYFNARLIINGIKNGIPDKANEFKDYAIRFEEILNEIF